MKRKKQVKKVLDDERKSLKIQELENQKTELDEEGK